MSKSDVSQLEHTVFWCSGSDCRDAGGKDVHKALRQSVRQAGLKTRVKFVKTHCTGQCKSAPIVIVCGSKNDSSGAVWYGKLQVTDADAIVKEHLESHCPVKSKLWGRRTVERRSKYFEHTTTASHDVCEAVVSPEEN